MTARSSAIPTADPRVTEVQLSEIRMRLINRLNDDGLRAWYPHDVALLLREVRALQAVIAAVADAQRANPALDGSEPSGDVVAAERAVSERWADVQSGVWSRAEVKRVQTMLKEATASNGALARALDAEKSRVSGLQAEIDQLQAQVVDTVADARKAAASLQADWQMRMASVAAILDDARSRLGA